MSTKLSKSDSECSFPELLKKREARIAAIAARNSDPKRVMAIALNCFSRIPALNACTPISIMRCIEQCASLGLEPGTALGAAYLIPFKQECTLIIGYRGLIELAFRSNQVKSIDADVVMKSDHFEFEKGLNLVLRHKPSLEAEPNENDMTHAYCVIHLKDGGHIATVMTKKQVDAIRKRSRSGASGPWVTDYLEMAKKTVIRRALKMAPMSIEMARAIEVDDASNGFTESLVTDADFSELDWSSDATPEDQPALNAQTGSKVASKLPPAPEEQGLLGGSE